MKKIVIIDIIQEPFWSVPSFFIETIKNLFSDAEIVILKDLEKERHQLKEATGIISFPIPANLVRGNEKLEWIHFLSAQIPLSWQKLSEKYSITNSKAGGDGVAEHALYLALKGLRGNSSEISKLAKNSKLGIIGHGNIGKKLSEMSSPLFKETRMLTHRDSSPLNTFYFNYDKKKDFFENLDIVVIATSLTEKSQAFFQSKDFFDLLPRDIILINISRGELFDEKEIINFFSNNPKAQYLTDVTYPEPYPQDGQLLKRENIYITPHIGGRFVGLWENFNQEVEMLLKDKK